MHGSTIVVSQHYARELLELDYDVPLQPELWARDVLAGEYTPVEKTTWNGSLLHFPY